jgi:hypothetical protein
MEDNSKSFSIKMTPYRKTQFNNNQSDKPPLEKGYIQHMSIYYQLERSLTDVAAGETQLAS